MIWAAGYAIAAVNMGAFMYFMLGMGDYTQREKVAISAILGVLWPLALISFVATALYERFRGE